MVLLLRAIGDSLVAMVRANDDSPVRRVLVNYYCVMTVVINDTIADRCEHLLQMFAWFHSFFHVDMFTPEKQLFFVIVGLIF